MLRHESRREYEAQMKEKQIQAFERKNALGLEIIEKKSGAFQTAAAGRWWRGLKGGEGVSEVVGQGPREETGGTRENSKLQTVSVVWQERVSAEEKPGSERSLGCV